MNEFLFSDAKTSVVGVIMPFILILLVILFVVSFYLFIKRIVIARRNTEKALIRIEAQLERILARLEVLDKGQRQVNSKEEAINKDG
ncbi:DUF4083 family protein [Paenibacillus septentrionalis]|uniref:DUF4083 family protein n=1 Tax=Paenibacillus septentrionalis TaxID=429342 RepID=A0ABW1V4W9_9BACL